MAVGCDDASERSGKPGNVTSNQCYSSYCSQGGADPMNACDGKQLDGSHDWCRKDGKPARMMQSEKMRGMRDEESRRILDVTI